MTAKITLSYEDRITQCHQHSLNDWEVTFLSSILLYVKGGRFAGLSDKQENKLQDIEKNSGLSRYYNEDGTKPFKVDSTDMQVIKPTAPSAYKPNPMVHTPRYYSDDDKIDDMEDDIPF